MATANDTQIGGNHYAKGGELQHWDLMDDHRVGYLEAAVTKYLTRWQDKDGVKDLRKADHFLAKLYEKRSALSFQELVERMPKVPRAEINRFLSANKVTGDEADIIALVLTWESTATITLCRGRLSQLIVRAEAEDGSEPTSAYVKQD